MGLRKFIANSRIDSKLIRAVIRQLGGREAFRDSASDIAEHGIDGGFTGFTWYAETVSFFKRNREAILNLAESQAEDMGVSVLEMVQGFRFLRDDPYTIGQIAKALYGPIRPDGDKSIPSAMAWYAAEEVARAYCQYLESSKSRAN
jgi:hypothetical protein